MQKLHTVRLSYLYIFSGTALLSGAFLFAARWLFTMLYSHYSGYPDALFVKAVHWAINHIGKIPSALILFTAMFCGIYMLRSQKIADDLKAVLAGTSEWADTGLAREIKVLSGGELGEIAANLNRIRNSGGASRNASNDVSSNANSNANSGADKDDTPLISLLVRTRAILLTLREAEETDNARETNLAIEAARSEARSMERFLESLIIEP